MKKYVAFFIALLIISVSVPFGSVSAETDIKTEIYDALKAHKATLDISKYKLGEDEAADIFFDVLLNTPELFFSDAAIDYNMKSSTVVKEYVFVYLMDKAETEKALAFYNAKLDEIISYMPKELDDFGKILWLHDYICANYAYDDTYQIYDAYNMLVKNEGVCQAYTLLYDALLERVGIDSLFVDSDEVNHIWNEVYLDGQWYYVDTTWDDPGNFAYGEVCYDYFLLSEDAFAADGEHGSDYVSKIKCNSTKYDDSNWRNSASPFGFADGKLYYTVELDIYSYDHVNNTSEVFYSIDEEFFATDYAEFYNQYFMGFGSLNGKLLFGVSDGVFSLDPDTLETEVIYAMPEGAGSVVSFHNVGSTGYYFLCDADDEEMTNVKGGTFTINIPEEIIEYILGDVSGNGIIDAKDYYLVKRAYLGTYELSKVEKLASDINENGILDSRDYALLKRAVLGTYTIE